MTQLPQIYLLALPIGNPSDLSLRAIQTLQEADWIFCEDSRKLRTLVEGVSVKLKNDVKLIRIPGDEEWNYPWSELEKVGNINIVLCSDAGTPGINDPGRALILEANKRNWPLLAIPGPSAPTLAVQWSGGFGLPFMFYGFAPKSSGKSWDSFTRALQESRTFVFFDTRYNILNTLKMLVDSGHGNRKCFLTREMTKTHEEIWSASVLEIKNKVENKLKEENVIGELTLLIEGAYEKESTSQLGRESPLELAQKMMSLTQLPPKQASKLLSELTGLTKQEAYDWMLKNKKDDQR